MKENKEHGKSPIKLVQPKHVRQKLNLIDKRPLYVEQSKLINDIQSANKEEYVTQKRSDSKQLSSPSTIIQCASGKFEVSSSSYNKLTSIPTNKPYNIGFKVKAVLNSDKPFSPTLQDRWGLTQWVKDKYDILNADGETLLEHESTDWERDEFGQDGDRGNWISNQEETIFCDEPGYTASNKLKSGEFLDMYQVWFKYTIQDNKTQNTFAEMGDIHLKVETDDKNNITYSSPYPSYHTEFDYPE